MSKTDELGSTPATPKSPLGPSLTQMLKYASGEATEPIDPKDRAIFEALKPKYDPKDMASKIEHDVRLNSIKPYLVSVSENIPDPIPMISRYGSIIASEGNISAIVGAAKSKKTFLCSALVGAMLRNDDKKPFGVEPSRSLVLWVDTEQSKLHTQRVTQRVLRIAGLDPHSNSEWLQSLTLREIDPSERFDVLRNSIECYRPRLVVVDGISDLMYNSNSIEESDAVVGEFMALSTKYNCHIMSILHTNPNSDKARGHIGSTLQRKVETMIYVRKVGDCSVVEPQFCRNEEFTPFAFTIDDEGLPEECDVPSATPDKESENSCVTILREGYPNGIDRKVLTTKLCEMLTIGRGHARMMVSRAISRGAVQENDGVVYLT